MCELLVRLIDNPQHPDPTVDCQRTKRGDVIVAMPDGHNWTPTERTSPHWVIVKVPEMSLPEGRALASIEPHPMNGTRQHFHKRLFHLDPVILPDADARVEEITLTSSRVRAAKRQKPPVKNPAVIGESVPLNVIG